MRMSFGGPETESMRWRVCVVVLAQLIIALTGCGSDSTSDLGPVTWSLQGNAPAVATINGGPWTLAQLAPGNPSPPKVPNQSYGYNAQFMTANSGKTSPMQPYYFPLIQGSGNNLQGYFDWRPKNINEAIVAANSTDGGQTWDFQQMVFVLTQKLPVNQQSADPDGLMVDDGFGHPRVIRYGDTTFLYALDRQADNVDKFGLIVSTLSPTKDAPLTGALLNIPLVPYQSTSVPDESQVLRTQGLKNPDGILAEVPGVWPTQVLYIQKIGSGDTALPDGQRCGTQPYAPSGASSPNSPIPNGTAFVNVRLASTVDGINFADQGTVFGLHDQTTISYVGTRWIAPGGTMLDLGGGRLGLFFSGGNCMDADADAFHYIGYAESTGGDLFNWTVINGINNPIASIGSHTLPVAGVPTTIPAQTPVVGPALDWWEGRVYSPSVAMSDQNTVTLTFAGYNVQSPKDDLLDYRTILTVKLKSSRPLPSQG